MIEKVVAHDPTPEQAARIIIVMELQKLLFPIQGYTEQWEAIVLQRGLLWLHYVDWAASIDLPLLIEKGMVVRDLEYSYQPTNSWKDHFPPLAYRLTPKGTDALENAARYVWGSP